MKIFNRTIALLIGLFVSISTVYGAEPENLDTAKQALVNYHDSGEYMQDLNAKIMQTELYLLQQVKANQQSAHPQKLAIVLDIDETALSNYARMYKMDFGGTRQAREAIMDKAQLPAIAATLALTKLAQENHVAVFFITGRPSDMRDSTIKNLHRAGFKDWQGLSLAPNKYTQPSMSTFKTAARKAITHQGYDIILNIGDQDSDLNGGYAKKTIKLPNPFYYTH